MTHSSADDFILKHRERFGVLGTNTLGKVERSVRSQREDGTQWSVDHHYRFGYRGEFFNCPQRENDFYMVDYAVAPNQCGSLRDEVVAALLHFHYRHGVLSLPGHGSLLTDTLITACREARIPFIVTQLEFSDLPLSRPTYPDIQVERITTSFARFSEFFEFFHSITRCVDAQIAFHAFVGFSSPFAHVYDTSIGLQFTDFNYDPAQGRSVGPANWCLVDADKRTATCRFLQSQGRAGLVDFFHYSPELMRAYLLSPRFRKLVEPGQDPRPENNFGNHFEILRDFYPELPSRENSPPLTSEHLSRLSPLITSLVTNRQWSSAEMWLTPLAYFVRKWVLPINLSELGEVYGNVI